MSAIAIPLPELRIAVALVLSCSSASLRQVTLRTKKLRQSLDERRSRLTEISAGKNDPSFRLQHAWIRTNRSLCSVREIVVSSSSVAPEMIWRMLMLVS